ncbi:Cof-type HAD-IIB family hydrolase [Companilactobacillus allii]|uniref:Haloacid dehalogenase n=1 Tax=Companilactobacillus allii TaxID=1847728 RepID=A0A1P8Q4R1_9LACO|nr:Cof-type HAD-IIB family hydrolase [Companilactobacillus allii]APX72833.1 hypothetical protein BTM29_09850 [Companilactobacillus allii]USQ67620.1 Cof-type HAD-IIB family hydrolase [Companilactobacillus allii]
MGKYKVAFFDIDGTLAGHRTKENTSILDRIPDSAKLALKRLREEKIEPVIATGRNVGMVKDILSELDVKSFIANNGRYVVFDDEVIFHDTFTNEYLEKVVNYFDSKKIEYCFETVNKLYVYEDSNFLGDGSMQLERIERGTFPEKVIQLIVMNDKEIGESVPIDGVKMLKVAPNVFDITMDESSKAIGIKKVLSNMNIESKDAIAFGDEINDLAMFEEVGYSVAMGDGNPKVQKVASYVTSGVYDDGIFNACKHLGLI